MPAISTTTTRAEKTTPKRKAKIKPAAKKKTVVVRPPTRPDATEATRTRGVAKASPDQQDRERTPARKAKDKTAVEGNIRRIKATIPKVYRDVPEGGVAVKQPNGKFKIQVRDPKAFKAAARQRLEDQAVPGSFAQAPALKVLEHTSRPLHAVAGAADAAVTHKNILKAAQRGLRNKDKTTFSDVLEHAGVKNKAVKGVVGFGLDVALDPTTYVTFGTGGVLKRGAMQAAKDAEKRALTKGLTTEQAKKFGERAGRKFEFSGKDAKGVTVKVAGKELPGVRKATAVAGKPAGKAAKKVTPRRVREGARGVAADLNPDVVPVGVTRETSRKAVQATRTARSKASRGTHEAQQHALGIKQQIGEARYSQVIDAIENGTIGKLPEELRDIAVRVRSQFRHANRQRKQAGIRGGEIKRRGAVKVPEVTANAGASAKALAKSRRSEGRAHGDVETARVAHDVHQGRAEVLSRNVSGVRAEKSAARGRRKRKVKRPARVMYHVVRDSATAKETKLEGIRAKGLKPSSGGAVYLYDDLAQAKEFAKGSGHILEVNVDGLAVQGGEGAATRTVRGRISAGRIRSYREGAPVRYAGGGHGVQTTASALKDAEQRLANATKERVAAEAKHVREVADGKVQQAARKQAEETNAARAAAPKEYIPHNLTDDALEAEGKAATGKRGSGRKVIRPTSSRARQDNRPLSVLRDEKPGRYSEDLPNLYAAHKAEGATSVARAELNRRIAELGKPLPKKGEDITLNAGEGVYHITGSDIRQVTDTKELARLAETGSHSGPMKGRYVVLNDDIVKRAVEGVTPAERTAIGAGYDKAQSGFKRIALATPGFHVRNAVGDTQNAYLGQAGHKLPRNMVQAGRILKAEGRRDKALKGMAPGKAKGGTIKTGRYGNVTYDKAAEELGKHGAMRSGYVGRELPELSGETAKVPRVRLPRKVKQGLLNREDLPRLTTAVEALKQGATWEEAAQKVADYHFDYAHLTKFERTTARRVLPFYTFTARNIPRQFKSLATHPGKFANYQKLIEEASKATGMDEESQKYRAQVKQLEAAGVKLPKGWQSQLSEWEQRNAGVPVSWRGHKFTVSFGLPLASGLNEVPGAAGKKQLDEYFQTAMALVSPLIKDPVEYFDNYSFFFRNQLESDTSPLVSAPSYVKLLPKGTRDDLGITQGLDKRTGKVIWRWPGKVDYIVKTVPGLPQYAQSLATEGTNRRGKGTGGKALQLFGVRAEPFDPDKTITNLAYSRVGEIQKRQAALRQSVNPANGFPVSAENPTREYVTLMKQLKVAQAVAYQGQARQGYKVLPKTGAPPKVKATSGKVSFGGSSGPKVKFGGGGGTKVNFGGG